MKSQSTHSKTQNEDWAAIQLRIHLKNKYLDAPLDKKIDRLKKRKRSRWIMLAVNIAAILFFGYSFYFDITQLSNTLLYILFAVFIINVILIFYQTTQLKKLIRYLERKDGRI